MSDKKVSQLSADAVTILDRRRVYDGFCKVDVLDVDYLRRDGRHAKLTRELHHHGSAVAVLPVDRDRRTALFVRQIRFPVLIEHGEGVLLEACAGLIDPGEDLQTAVAREMEEELGFRPSKLTQIGEIFPSPGVLAEKLTLFLANYTPADRTDEGGGKEDEGEDIEIVEISCSDLPEMILNGDVKDAKTVIMVQHLMLQMPDLFR